MPRYTRKKVEENPERKIVLGMVVSDRFCKEVQPILRQDLLQTPFMSTVIEWCQEYFEQFEKAPGVHIEDIYEKHLQEGNLEDAQEELIAELLLSLSDEYGRSDNFNENYLLDQAEKYFEKRNLLTTANEIRTSLKNDDIYRAKIALTEHKEVNSPKTLGINPLIDTEEMRKAFSYSSEPLYKLPGVAGDFVNDMLVRSGFVVLLGPEKRGKTWMLIEHSIQARKAGLNVAFISAGDMTAEELQLRYATRFTARHPNPKFCKEILIPTLDCKHNQDDSCDKPERLCDFGIFDEEKKTLFPFEEAEDYTPCAVCRRKRDFKPSSWFRKREEIKPLEWQEAAKAGQKLDRRWGKKARLLLAAFPNGTLSIQGLEAQLDIWENHQNFIPDVIITDYMDLLEDDKREDSYRHKINNIWKTARKISQERHCLFLSATQSDAASYYVKWLGMQHFSESKTKNAHITGIITLNQTMEEKKRKIMRLGKLLTREDDFLQNKGVVVLQSPETGRPLLNSYKHIEEKKDANSYKKV